MKTLFGLFCLLAICSLTTAFQLSKRGVPALTDWVICQVDKQFSAQLPTQPVEMDMVKVFADKGITLSAEQLEIVKGMRTFAATDGTANYMIARSIIAIQVNLDTPDGRSSFYDGAIDRLMSNEHGTLLQRSAFSVGGIEGVQMSYRGMHKDTGKMIIKYNRMLVANKMMYLLSIYPVDRNDSTGVTLGEQRTRFFNSIAYKPATQTAK